jgi:DNA-binding response OmpR family regulator
VNVVLLSTSKERVDAIRAASRRKGFECTVVADEQHASAAIHGSNAGILVIDAGSAQGLDHLLKTRAPGWPVLVLAHHFDSSAWVEMFKAGASEVIGDPLDARKVDAAFDGFIHEPSQGTRVQTIWRSLARRFGFGADPQMR